MSIPVFAARVKTSPGRQALRLETSPAPTGTKNFGRMPELKAELMPTVNGL